MDAVTLITSLLTLFAGVGVFLIACNMMSTNLESLGSKKLKALFSKTSKSKLFGVGAGAAVTAAIQSSSATSVMVIGFVNAGIMSLNQAACIIFGANIGTTITGQIVALGMFGNGGISSSVIFSALAGAGAFMSLFAKRDVLQKTGGILAGFGMIFVGLSVMSGSMKGFAEMDEVRNFLAIFQNPLLLVLLGAMFTALIQSSSVMTTMAITMTVSGLITLNQGVYITMGSNVGTCITAMIAGMSGGQNAKRTALLHLIFNVSGVILFLLIGMFLRLGNIDYGYIFETVFPHAPQTQLAMFHTVFNVITVILILPLTNLLVKLATKIIPDKKQKPSKGEPHMFFVNDNMLTTPPVAVNQTKNEILNMAQVAISNFKLACKTICTLDFSQEQKFFENERQLDFLNRELVMFIVRLSKSRLSERDRVYLSTAIRSISDFERVGDYAENIVGYAKKLASAEGAFSADACKEIDRLKNLICDLFDNVFKAYKDCDKNSLEKADNIEERIDALCALMTENHIKRLGAGVCSSETGVHFLSLTANAERVADHLINVGKTINLL